MKKFIKENKYKIILTIIGIIVYFLIGIKYNNVFRYSILFTTIYGGAIFTSNIFKKDIGSAIPVSIMSIMAILYIFGIIGLLKTGAILIVAIYNILGVFTLILKLKNKELKNFCKNSISTSAVIFALFFIVFACTTYEKMFNIWDEFTHWSLASKNMFYTNAFALNENSTMDFYYPASLYPPSPTIFQYFCCKVIGEYKQGIEIFAMQMLGFSCLLSLLKNVKRKNIIAVCISTFIVLAIPSIFCETYFYATIYADALLGILIGYMFLEYFTSKKDKFTYISLGLAAFVLSITKPTGIVALLIVCASLGIYELLTKIRNKIINKEKHFINVIFNKEIILIALLFLIGFITFISWQVYTSYEFSKRDIEVQENADIAKLSYEGNPIKYILRIAYKTAITGVNEYDTESVEKDVKSTEYYIEHLFDKAQFGSKPFNMSMSSWLVVFILSSVAIHTFCIKDKSDKNKFVFMVITLLMSSILYFIFIQVAYLLQFSNNEGIIHSSIFRYAGTYLIAVFMTIAGLAIYYLEENDNINNKKAIIVIGAIVLLFTPMQPIANEIFVSGAYNQEKQKQVSFIRNIAENVKNNIEKDAKVYPIHQTALNDTYVLMFKYFLTPTYAQTTQMFPKNENNAILGANNVEEWKEILYNRFDYVYVLNSDEYFNSNFNTAFENNEVKEWTLYKVEKNNENKDIKLIPMDI